MSLQPLRHLEMVRALAEYRHFGRAADALGVSQPSLTRSLKHLEDQLGVRLFERHDGVTPTIFGRAMIERGESLLLGYSELLREIALMKGLGVGALKVATGPYPAEISAQKAMGLLAARHPGLHLQLTMTDGARVIDDLLHGRVDLGLVDVSEAIPHQDLEAQPVRTSRLHFYCRSGHPLAARANPGVADLMEFPWVGPTAPARIRSAMPETDKPYGLFDPIKNRFQPRVVVDTVSAAKDVVLASDALAVALPTMIEHELNTCRCVLLPVELAWMRLNYGFIWKRGRTPSPAAVAFMQIVHTIEKDIPA
jgi:DNA-binding transcriptional LysR family regulator